MKQTYFIFGIIVVASIVASIFIFDNTQQPRNSDNEALLTSDNGEVGTLYPKEYMIYQDYLQAIGEGLSATPRYFDNGVIEATIISVTNSDVCPSATGETCNIEPYPNDYAIIIIDKVVSYSPYSEQTVSQPVEQPSGTPAEEGSSIPGNKGTDYPKQKISEITRLEEGQNASVHFTLTTRPVKVRYVSVEPENGGLESQQTLSGDSDMTQTVTHTVKPGGKTFKPIPKENGYFVFTTKIVPYPEVSQKILLGLKTGDKFRANIKYDGTTVVICEYEIIP